MVSAEGEQVMPDTLTADELAADELTPDELVLAMIELLIERGEPDEEEA